MKKLICFGAAALLSFQFFAVDIFSTGAVSLTGKVQSFTRTDYSVTTKFGNYFRTPAAKTTHNFTDGKETEEIHLTPRDVVIRKVVFTYDDDGNLSEKACSNAENDLEWKTAMTYKDGVQQDHSEYDSTGNLKARTIYTYTYGLMTDKTVYDGEGALLEKTIYVYTDSGKIASGFSKSVEDALDSGISTTHALYQEMLRTNNRSVISDNPQQIGADFSIFAAVSA